MREINGRTLTIFFFLVVPLQGQNITSPKVKEMQQKDFNTH